RLAAVPHELDARGAFERAVVARDVLVDTLQVLAAHPRLVGEVLVLVTVTAAQIALLAHLDDELNFARLWHEFSTKRTPRLAPRMRAASRGVIHTPQKRIISRGSVFEERLIHVGSGRGRLALAADLGGVAHFFRSYLYEGWAWDREAERGIVRDS